MCEQIPASWSSGNQGMVLNGMEDDFSIFLTGNILPFHKKNLPFHTKFFFHNSIPYFITKKSLDRKQRVTCIVLLIVCGMVRCLSFCINYLHIIIYTFLFK